MKHRVHTLCLGERCLTDSENRYLNDLEDISYTENNQCPKCRHRLYREVAGHCATFREYWSKDTT